MRVVNGAEDVEGDGHDWRPAFETMVLLAMEQVAHAELSGDIDGEERTQTWPPFLHEGTREGIRFSE